MKRWLIWGGIMLVWTAALEAPVPVNEHMPGGPFILSNKFIFAKSLHVAVYAFLTLLSAWMPVPLRWRWSMLLILLVHAGATELLQAVLEPYCHRGGSLEDVGFDQIGMFAGLLFGWKWWTRPNS